MKRVEFSYDVPQGHRALDCFAGKQFAADASTMSATGIFAAASKDRHGDLLEIAGIKTENHAKNPVVLWLHGLSWRNAENDFPIGKAEDPNGNYTVKLLKDEGIAVATTFFSQKTLLAEQVFALVMEGTIRGQSIGYRSLKYDAMYEDDRYVGDHLTETELIEFSWVPIPMNQDAVRACLSRDQVAGKALAPSIKAALAPYAGQAPAWANGATLGVKIMNEVPAKTKADDEKPEEKPEEEKDDDEAEGVEKHGSKSCRAGHKCLSKAYKALCKAADPLDDDSETKSLLESHAEAAKSGMEEIKAHHAKKYKDEDPIEDEDTKDDDEGGGGDDDSGDDGEKKMSDADRKQAQRIAHKLRMLNKDK